VNAQARHRTDVAALWLVVEWIDDDPRYRPVAAFASREEAANEAARHPGAMILFRPAPVPATDQKDEF
jgi:hypothetical protein